MRAPSAGKRDGEVVEHLAHRAALGENLALAARLVAKRRWNPDDAHACAGPAQNST